MDLFSMQYAVAVADNLNFSLAAEQCGIGQSALSQQISKLEEELGVTLFYRTSKTVKTTEAGDVFIQGARQVLQSVEALRSEMALYSGLRKGSLRLGIITSLECIHFGDMLSGRSTRRSSTTLPRGCGTPSTISGWERTGIPWQSRRSTHWQSGAASVCGS